MSRPAAIPESASSRDPDGVDSAAFSLLVDVLRDGTIPAASGEDAGAQAPAPVVARAIQLAVEHGVAPTFARSVKASAVPLPAALATRLDELLRESAVNAFWWTSELKGVLEALAIAHLDVMPLKGPFFADRFYGGAAYRPCRDLDLLVRREDFERAEAVLARQGFQAASEGDDYHRTWIRGSTGLELHFDVENPLAFDFDLEAAWRRASSSEAFGHPVCELETTDEFVFLCLHAARHRFERLSHVLDLAQMLRQRPVLRTALPNLRRELAGLRGVVALGCLMARRLLPTGSAEISLPLPEKQAAPMRTLAAGLWRDLACGPHAPLDWAGQHRFFLDLESGRVNRLARRVRHLRILAARLIDEDYAFAARLGLRRRWHARLLRPVRLALDSGSTRRELENAD